MTPKNYKLVDGKKVEVSEKEFNEYKNPPMRNSDGTLLNEDAYSQATLAPKSKPASYDTYDDAVKTEPN